jgi:hypothetical protein
LKNAWVGRPSLFLEYRGAGKKRAASLPAGRIHDKRMAKGPIAFQVEREGRPQRSR